MIKEEMLKALRESGDFVSGQELCERFGVSRTAVWKAAARLKEEGYEIESVSNRGYRLKALPDVVTEAEIGSRLKTRVMGRNCVCFDSADSTNVQAKRLAEEGAPHGTLVCAETQTAGRGRRGRAWSSPPGAAVYMSLLLRPKVRPEHASMLTLVMGLAAAEACNELLSRAAAGKPSVPQTGLKWPNDLVLDGKKTAGILTEMSTQVDYINHVTVGVGINVNMTEFPEAISQTATSLRLECGHAVKRAPVIAAVMERLEANYDIFMKTQDLSGLMEKYSSMLVNRDREVRVIGVRESYQAHAEGITKTGELIVRREDGTVENICAGEVSVRGVYGYV